MEELAKIRKSPTTGNSILFASDLYNSLGITKEFVHWINAKIRTLSLVEKKDFYLVFYDAIGNRVLESSCMVARIDCILTITAAKTIALSYKNSKSNKIAQILSATELKETPSELVIETVKVEVESDPEIEITEMVHPNLISSLEIAKATDKLHKHVMDDIRTMCMHGGIVIDANSTLIDTEEVVILNSEYEANLGMGRVRRYKQYLLNEMAADVLATGYDVKRRIAVHKLVKRMKIALEQRPVQTIMIEAKNIGFNEAGKLFGTNGRGINHTLKKAGYLRPNNKPYEKHVLQGYFAWELYDERFTNKHLTVTPIKGMSLLQELYNKKVNLPAIQQALPLSQVVEAHTPILSAENSILILSGLRLMADHTIFCKEGGHVSKSENEAFLSKLKSLSSEITKFIPIKSLEKL